MIWGVKETEEKNNLEDWRWTTNLEAIEADDTVSVGNIALSQDFFSFLEEEKQKNR